MGTYVGVRGWLEFTHEQRAAVEEVLAAHRHDPYSDGWAVPARPFNWTLYVSHGGDVRAPSVDWLRSQVAELALLADSDGDRPVGFFLLTDERRHATAWTVRDGVAHEGAAPEELRGFA
ncbi:hypothetical protein BBK82_10245 [Lentzea guizhouensis]|uniref:Uncharacterized protein n=1 Tax=Lentzea guizhouensis TaxID=1586287 RepID=A0A1B2HY37_9PSEU|nr:hypothetical protein [Lentzea guizhouensis]ANZ42632.1 hypothetical protein BBK82_10245 [Lentzea guizhouensis]